MGKLSSLSVVSSMKTVHTVMINLYFFLIQHFMLQYSGGLLKLNSHLYSPGPGCMNNFIQQRLVNPYPVDKVC